MHSVYDLFISDVFQDHTNVWTLGKSPINLTELQIMLLNYRDRDIAATLYEGFLYGFKIHYSGPRTAVDSKNLKSVFQHPSLVLEKVQSEIELGRIAGPFHNRPISNLRCSLIGLVPKKTGGFRLIAHLSHPSFESVYSYIDSEFSLVKYSTFDHAISLIQRLGKGALIGKKDLKSAFRLLPVYPGCFDLLGFKLEGNSYIDKMMPMGCSESCSYFERFSIFIEWVVRNEANSYNIKHYLDDFLFAGEGNTDVCNRLMNNFSLVCDRLNVPIANEKSVGPTTVLEYLGLTIDTVNMLVKIPDDKILELKEKMSFVLKSKKAILKVLQSLAGSLAFCTRAFLSGRVFSGRIYNAMSNVKNSYHFIRVSKNLKADLLVWSQFLENIQWYFLYSGQKLDIK